MKEVYDVPMPAMALNPPRAPLGHLGSWAESPYRPEPNPATGELTVDPEISLKTKGGTFDISFYYNSQSAENSIYGVNRTASIENYIVSNTGDIGNGVQIIRGDGGIFAFTGTPGAYVPVAIQNSGTTIAYNATSNQFTEYFPGGSQCIYKNQGETLPSGNIRHDLIASISPAGLRTTYTYSTGSGAGYPQTVQMPTGQIVSMSYLSSSPTPLLQAVEDWSGRIWTFAYDVNRNMTQLTMPLGCSTQYGYVKFAAPNATMMYSIQDPQGFSTYYGYDASMRVVTMAYGSAVVSWQYSGTISGSVRTDPTGAKTTYLLNNKGQIQTESRPEGFVITYGYDANGFKNAVQTPQGFTTSLIFNSSGLATTSIDPLGNRTTYQYDVHQNPTTVIDALGYVWTQLFDSSRNLTVQVDPLGRRSSMTFDVYGQVLSQQDPRGLISSYSYDAFGNMASVLYSDGGVITNTYDILNRVIATRDQIGRTTSFAYDAGNNRISTMDALGNVSSSIYLTCLLQAQIDPLGNRTSYTYNRFNSVVSQTNALGFITTTQYDVMGFPTTFIDALGYTMQRVYNPAHQAIASVDQLGFRTTYGFDNAGRPQTAQDARGFVTSTVYNARDAIASIDPLGNRWTTTYDALARAIASTTPLGFVSSTVYDAAGQNIARVDALGFATSYSYDASGNRTSVAVPASAFVTASRSDSPPSSVNLTSEGTLDWAQWGYASASSFCHKSTGGGLIGDPTGFGGAVFHWYGGNYTSFNWTDGNPLTTESGTQNGIYTEDTPGQGYQILVAADTTPRTLKLYCGGWASLGKLTATLSDGTTATYLDIAGNEGSNYYCVYTIEFQASQPGVQLIVQWELNTVPGDGNTNLIAASLVSSSTLTGQNASEFIYSNTSNRLAAEIDPLGFATSYIYDLAGEKLQRVNPQGYAVSWTYDLVGRQLAVANEIGLCTSYAYDARGLRSTRQFANGEVTSYLYDAVGQQLQRSYADGTAVTFSYDPRGFNTTVIDWAGYTTYSLDARGLLSGKTDPGGITQAYLYDAVQNRVGLTNPDGGLFTYAYDSLNRSASAINPSNEVVTSSYDADSRRTLMSTPSSSRAMAYDSVGQLTTIIQYQGVSQVESYVDAYDGAGWKTAHAVDGGVTTYLNDAKGRLLGQSGSGITATFAYDVVDNTLLKWHQGEAPLTMSYDPASRLTQVLNGDSVITYAFDNNGNMTQEYVSDGGLSFMKAVYQYDPENRQSNVIAGSAVSTYSYAGDTGLRRTRQEPGQQVHTIVWDGPDYLGEY